METNNIVEYWKEQLNKSHRYMHVPSDFSKRNDRCIKKITKELENNTYNAIRELCNNNIFSEFVLYLTCYSILISQLSDSYQFELIAPEFSSNVQERKHIMIPIEIDPNMTLKEQLLKVAETIRVIREYEAVDLLKLMDQLGIDAESYKFGISSSELHSPSNIEHMNSDYFLQYNLNMNQNRLELIYDSSLIQKETADLFCERFMKILKEITTDIDKKVSEIDYFIKNEYSRILEELVNGTKDNWLLNTTICNHFLDQADANPLKTAVEQVNQKISYQELNEKSDIIAEYILSIQGEENNYVGIMLDRSIEMMIGIIGILKAGCAYVPISPKFPKERIKYILQDTNLKIMITTSEYQELVTDVDTLIDVSDLKLYDKKIETHINMAKPEDIMYVIYTSGSTGKPKGTLISHKAFLNRIYWMNKEYPIDEDDVILQKTAFTFDVSVWELFWWIIGGSKLVLLEKEGEYKPQVIIKTIEEKGVSVIHFVPSMLYVFLQQLDKSIVSSLSSLKYVFSSGEELHTVYVENFLSLFENVSTRLINLYGPTEATIDVTYYECSQADLYSRIPIGRPISNHKIYILDEQFNICPIGIQGELCIAGVGLANSYLNQKELTDEKFIYLKLSNEDTTQERIYRTGDIAKWNNNGLIEYIGRKDEQIKLRGHRIEIQEIENVLLNYHDITETAVVFDRNESTLTAFFVSDKQIEKQELRAYLQNHIPQYMIPNNFVRVISIPKTSHGKVDKKALLLMKHEENKQTESELLQKYKPILDIFRNELHREINRLDETFFALGGDSLKAIMISSRLTKLNYDMNINTLYENQTIREICKEIYDCNASKDSIGNRDEVTEYNLTPIQLGFMKQNFTDSDYYNISILLDKEGQTDSSIIAQSLEKIIRLHKVLNTKIEVVDNQYHICKYDGDGKQYVMKVVDLSEVPQHEKQRIIIQENISIQKRFSIKNSPLIGCIIYQDRNQSHLFLAIHHLLVDGVSLRIILEELDEIYDALSMGVEPKLVPEITTYGQYSRYLYEFSQSDKIKNEIDYWKGLIQNPAREIFPVDKEIDRKLKNVTQLHLAFTEGETQQILSCINKEKNIDFYSLLLTAVGMSLYEVSNKRDFIINIEKNGRSVPSNSINLSRTVGWFSNFYPVYLAVEPNDIYETFRKVQDTIQQVENDGLGYLLLKHLLEKENIQDEPQVIINFLGEMILDDTMKNYRISQYDTGTSISPEIERKYLIDIKGYILHNELHFTIDYYKESLTECLMQQFITTLKISLLNIAKSVHDTDYIVSKSIALDSNIDSLLSAIENM